MSAKIMDRRESLMLTSTTDSEDELEANDEDTQCGMGTFRPNWIQKFNNTKTFLVNNGVLGLLNGATFTYFIGCISTLEKRYAFETQVTGIVMISEELCPFLLGFLIGYFGSKSHRPRFMAASMAVSAMSSFVLATPYFVYGAIKDVSVLEHYTNQTDFELCGKPQTDDLCDKKPTLLAVSLFFIGLSMKGLGNVAYYTIGTPYLDDNVKKKNSAMYLATTMTIQLMGPALGFLLSSLCLLFYEDPFYDPGYGPDDPRWIGAWWIGFLVIGTCMFVFMLPVWLYPRRFPGMKLPKGLQQKNEKSKSCREHLKDMKDVFVRLYKNPILICNQLGSIMRINGLEGYFILMPKYMEMQFKQSASKANLLSGPLLIVLMQIALMLGGFCISKFRPRARVLTGGIAITQAFSALSLIACMLISCPSLELSGTTSLSNSQFSLENDCNRDCSCTTKSYTPICGPDGKSSYFSPCHAGCEGFNTTDDNKIYTDCKCVHDDLGGLTTGNSIDSYCDSDCQGLLIYVGILGIGKFIFSSLGVANVLVTLRCVDPGDKSIALGAVTALYSVLAFFPYPLLYGALTDSSCLVWEESCGKTGNCWIYDVDDFRYKLHGASVIFLIIGCFFDTCVWVLSKRLTNLYEDVVEQDVESKLDGLEMKPAVKLSTEGELIQNNQSETEAEDNNAFSSELKSRIRTGE